MTSKIRLILMGIVTLLMWAHLGWDYFHGGVPTHHIGMSENLPGISNWWGGIVLPLLTWFLLIRIQNRLKESVESGIKTNLRNIFYGFLGSLMFGVLFSFFFVHGYFPSGSDLPQYVLLTLILISFFIPLYRAEYLLGFVVGMTYTFGPIIPIGLGLLLMILFAITYKYIRSGILFVLSMIKGEAGI